MQGDIEDKSPASRSATWDVDLVKRWRAAGSGQGDRIIALRFGTSHRRVVIRGASGTGKTVILKLIAGVLKPDSGHVSIDGATLVDTNRRLSVPSSRRRLGVVFQDYRLFPHLTVRQNVAYARHRGWFNPGRRWRDDVVDRWLDTMRLAQVAGSYPHQISGGQRQRVALARALALEPRALLLDEPFAALDQPLREAMRQELLQLQRTLDMPMLMVTHDPDDVRHLAEHVVGMPDH